MVSPEQTTIIGIEHAMSARCALASCAESAMVNEWRRKVATRSRCRALTTLATFPRRGAQTLDQSERRAMASKAHGAEREREATTTWRPGFELLRGYLSGVHEAREADRDHHIAGGGASTLGGAPLWPRERFTMKGDSACPRWCGGVTTARANAKKRVRNGAAVAK